MQLLAPEKKSLKNRNKQLANNACRKSFSVSNDEAQQKKTMMHKLGNQTHRHRDSKRNEEKNKPFYWYLVYSNATVTGYHERKINLFNLHRQNLTMTIL